MAGVRSVTTSVSCFGRSTTIKFANCVFLIAAGICGLVDPSSAWNKTGHTTIGLIAESLLTPEANAKTDELLALEGFDDLGDVANWADKIRHRRDGTPRHTVRLPLNDEPYDEARHCRKRRCVVASIEDQLAILSDPGNPDGLRLEALKYVVHLVGDVHSPAHASKRKASEVDVEFEGEDVPLSKLLDRLAVTSAALTPEAFASTLLQRVSDTSRRTAGQGSLEPSDWAEESRDIARDVVFPMLEEGDDAVSRVSSDDFASRLRPVVEDRLLAAGVRLAAVLNQALD